MSTFVRITAATACLLAVQGPLAPDVRLECPAVTMAESMAGGWTVLVQDDAFLVIVTRWDERDRGKQVAPASFVSTVVEVREEAAARPETPWVQATQYAFGYDVVGYLPSIAALATESGDHVYLVNERASAAKVLAWTILPRSLLAGSPGREAARAGAFDWRHVLQIRDPLALARPRRLDLTQPSLASFRGQVLLAGDTYDSAGSSRDTWVGPLAEPRDRTLDAVLVGSGWKPALVPAGERLFCFAIYKPGWRPYGDFSGSLVAWRSPDAEQWEPWAPGVPLDNVVRVDACSDGDTALVACLTAAPEPRIHVYRLDPDKEGLTEVLAVDPAPEGTLGRDIAIRLLKGTPYLFWQDNVGDDPHALFSKNHVGNVKTFIVIRRLELAALRDAAGTVDESHPGGEG